MSILGLILITIACSGLGLFAVMNPLVTWLASIGCPLKIRRGCSSATSVSIIIVVRNGRDLIGPKLDNTLHLDIPGEKLEVIVHSDGSDDGTDEFLQSRYSRYGIHISATPTHMGKTFGLNTAAAIAKGDICIFSDADALLRKDAVNRLLCWFEDPRVGGVCGMRELPAAKDGFGEAQAGYVNLDSRIKMWESSQGRLTSNDGKLYAIRRELMPKIPSAVTDDLYVALSVIKAGKLFIFDPSARAAVAIPSRSPAHEILRRRRIVSGSLHAISCHKELLNPRRHGLYALQLLINKGLRRFIPFFLILFFTGTALAARTNLIAALLLAGQSASYLFALISPCILAKIKGKLANLLSRWYYFCCGNLGMLLGVVDFFRRNLPAKWDPDKKPITEEHKDLR